MKKVFLLLSALVMTVTAAMADTATFDFGASTYGVPGAERQTLSALPTGFYGDATLSCFTEAEMVQAPVELSLKRVDNAGKGFAFVQYKNLPEFAGLGVYNCLSGTDKTLPEITLSVPGGVITQVKVNVSGAGISGTFDFSFNGNKVNAKAEELTYSSESTKYKSASLEWNAGEDGVAEVKFSWASTYYITIINSIEVTYIKDGKSPANLSFPTSSISGTFGIGELNAPTLSNPDNLDVTYSSSNTDLIVVDPATGSLAWGPANQTGTVTITAAFAGNDKFRAKSVKYTVDVTACADSFGDFLLTTNKSGAKAYINFETVVAYANGAYTFIQDLDGKYGAYINESTGYTAGQIIPKGWVATSSAVNGSIAYKMSVKPASTSTATVSPAAVETVTLDDYGKVVELLQVAINSATPKTAAAFNVVGTDGTEYAAYNQFALESVNPGYYNMECAVITSSANTIRLLPIALTEVYVVPAVEKLSVNIQDGNTTVTEIDDDEYCITANATVPFATAALTVEPPLGFDGFYYSEPSVGGLRKPAKESEEESPWLTGEEVLAEGYAKAENNVINVPADGQTHSYYIILAKGDKAYLPAFYMIMATASESDPTVPTAEELVSDITISGLEDTPSVKYDDEEGYIVATTTVLKRDGAEVTLKVPYGYTSYIYLDASGMTAPAAEVDDDEAGKWIPVAQMVEAGWKEGTSFTVEIPADENTISKGYHLMLVKDGKADYEASYNLMVTANYEKPSIKAKDFTFDFATEDYGMTRTTTTFANNKVFCDYEGFKLTCNTSSSISFTTDGLVLNGYPAKFTVASTEGKILNVSVVSEPENAAWKIEYNDATGVATVQNYGESFDKYIIKQMKVEYGKDLRFEAKLEFDASTVDYISGKSEELKAPVLTNEENLPLTFTSSNPEVISVNENGELTVVNASAPSCTVTITAAYDPGEDGEYRPVQASYNINYLPCANSINELKAVADEKGSKAYVNFESVVSYANGNFTYIQSLDGKEFTELYQELGYTPGNVIPAGWTAESTKGQVLNYKMSAQPESTETQTPVIPRVSELSEDMVTEVIVLKGITIPEDQQSKVPATGGSAYTTYNITVGEQTVQCYNQFKPARPEDLTIAFDLKCAVMWYNGNYRLYPIEYAEAVPDPVLEPGEVTFDFVNETYGLERLSGSTQDYIVEGTDISQSPVIVTFKSSIVEEHSNASGSRLWSDGLRVYNGGTLVITVAEGYVVSNVEFTSKTNTSFSVTKESDGYVIAYTPTSKNVAIQTLTVAYKPATNKKPADLSFDETSYSVGSNITYFTEATLNNPNNLEVTYTSSNPEVAEITANGIKVVAPGVTTITAVSAETDEYDEGEASYTLTVVAAASNVAGMMEIAPNKGDKVLMNGPLTVAYANGDYVYVYDIKDKATLLWGKNDYKTGDEIPAGWVAENATFNGLLEWKGEFPAATGNFAEYLEYPEVESVTEADVNRVVTIPGLTLTEATSGTVNSSVKATLPDGNEILVYNKFGIESVEAGKYNLIAAVSLYNGAVQLYPIEYVVPSNDPVFPESFNLTYDTSANTEVEVEQKIDPNGGLEININGKTSYDQFTVTFEIPEGWTGMLVDTGMDPDITVTDGNVAPLRAAAYWYPVEQFIAQGWTQGNTITVNADNIKAMLTGVLVNGDMADMAHQFGINIKVAHDETVGVATINAAEEGARYFTLDGVEVKNPAKGVYVKVLNGKAEKVNIR